MKIKFTEAKLAFVVGSSIHEVFTSINTELESGLHFIVGQSGSGKTSFLRLINFDNVISEGKMMIDGVDVAKYLNPMKSRYLERVFFPTDLFLDNYSLLDNFVLILRRPEESLSEATNRIKKEFTFDFFERKYRTLSSGQRSKAVMAIANIIDKDVILYDEPTANLANEDIKETIQSFLDLAKSKLVIISTNDERVKDIDGAFYHVIKEGELK